MFRSVLVLLTLLVLLTACETVGSIIETSPKVTEGEVLRMLCARDATGQRFLFGPIYPSKQDTELTRLQIEAHNDAWDAATNEGKSCGALGTAPFGGMTWGTK